jgi:hypothetical protein
VHGAPVAPSHRQGGEFFAVAFRRTFYESVDQLQRDLDRYLDFYNRERAHQGYRTKGRTPYQAFCGFRIIWPPDFRIFWPLHGVESGGWSQHL